MSRAVVIQTAWLGDAVLTTPLLRAAGDRHAGVDVVTTPAAAPLLETHPAVHRVHVFDKRGRDRGIRGLLRTAAALRRCSYRTAYLPQGSLRSALLALLAGIPERVGFAHTPGRRLYTKRIGPSGAHEAVRLLALVEDGISSELELTLNNADRDAAGAALDSAGIAEPFVVLATGSARASKRWPYYRELAGRLAVHCPVVLVGGPAEGWGDAVPSDRPSVRRCIDLTGLPVRTSAAVVALARVAVTNDSAPLHIAQAVGTPVVALFGPTVPESGFGPRGDHDEALGVAELSCRPCSTHGGPRCPLRHHRCLRDLDLETVYAAVQRALARREAVCA